MPVRSMGRDQGECSTSRVVDELSASPDVVPPLNVLVPVVSEITYSIMAETGDAGFSGCFPSLFRILCSAALLSCA